ncbi:TadE-like protein [Pirellulimonas nuda]|uniref:TadE-like protein n=1 Tax=Pirellulimonas nuda TaxID=2528009 RepID=A0A518D9G9_9BACT|nr:TadE/TadG family type IV pilus assembly protein [Pirellulimonas nuda]QDU88132.1 TadE-like protein [Pirellulimonas nuda]
MRSRTRHHPPRRGATVVEFALTAPLLFMFAFASIEFSRANMLVHTAKIAATEGARRGIVPGATAEDCRAAAQGELDILGFVGGTVTVTPATISDATPEVNVTVSVPVDVRNGYVLPRFFLGSTVTRSINLQREVTDFN